VHAPDAVVKSGARSVLLPRHVPAQLAHYRRRRASKALGDEPDRAAALDADEDFLSLLKRQVSTAALGSDVCRDHAASLPEPTVACVLLETERGGSFSSHLTGTDQQPELAL